MCCALRPITPEGISSRPWGAPSSVRDWCQTTWKADETSSALAECVSPACPTGCWRRGPLAPHTWAGSGHATIVAYTLDATARRSGLDAFTLRAAHKGQANCLDRVVECVISTVSLIFLGIEVRQILCECPLEIH